MAGQTPSEALEAQRRKRNEIIGEMVAGGKQLIQTEDEGQRLPIDTAVQIFLAHIKTHSPAKPRTLERYNEVLGHFQRLLEKRSTLRQFTVLITPGLSPANRLVAWCHRGGDSIEVAMAGYDSMIGFPGIGRKNENAFRAQVQVAGGALRVSARVLQAAIKQESQIY